MEELLRAARAGQTSIAEAHLSKLSGDAMRSSAAAALGAARGARRWDTVSYLADVLATPEELGGASTPEPASVGDLVVAAEGGGGGAAEGGGGGGGGAARDAEPRPMPRGWQSDGPDWYHHKSTSENLHRLRPGYGMTAFPAPSAKSRHAGGGGAAPDGEGGELAEASGHKPSYRGHREYATTAQERLAQSRHETSEKADLAAHVATHEKIRAETAIRFGVASEDIPAGVYGSETRPTQSANLAGPPGSLFEARAAVVPPGPLRVRLALPAEAAGEHGVETDGTRASLFAAVAAVAGAALRPAAARLSDFVLTCVWGPGSDGVWVAKVVREEGCAGGADDEADAAEVPPFPYKRSFLPDPVETYFERLRSKTYVTPSRYAYARGSRRVYPPAKGERWMYRPQPGAALQQYALVVNEEAYHEVDVITDIFTEEARMAARVKGKLSPREAWANPVSRAAILAKAKTVRPNPRAHAPGTEALYAAREAVWHAAPEATSFKVSLAAAIYRHFGAKAVLDPCAGWGDRMLGAAAAAGVQRYVGLDPNPALVRGHREIAQFAARRLLAKVRPIPAEAYTRAQFEADFPEGPPGLVFTSPPFFDYEHYSDDARQSTATHTTLDDWVAGWLLPVMGKFWGFLAPGGHFALYIADAGGAVVRPLLDHMGALGTFRGVVACRRGRKRPVPLFVWKKEEA